MTIKELYDSIDGEPISSKDVFLPNNFNSSCYISEDEIFFYVGLRLKENDEREAAFGKRCYWIIEQENNEIGNKHTGDVCYFPFLKSYHKVEKVFRLKDGHVFSEPFIDTKDIKVKKIENLILVLPHNCVDIRFHIYGVNYPTKYQNDVLKLLSDEIIGTIFFEEASEFNEHFIKTFFGFCRGKNELLNGETIPPYFPFVRTGEYNEGQSFVTVLKGYKILKTQYPDFFNTKPLFGLVLIEKCVEVANEELCFDIQ